MKKEAAAVTKLEAHSYNIIFFGRTLLVSNAKITPKTGGSISRRIDCGGETGTYTARRLCLHLAHFRTYYELIARKHAGYTCRTHEETKI